eukprot:TRINITY_DN12459_c0_g1_i1.p1 TRINITY_DN12459_c0_g1~~TRINITY_DN12459_c0_g1_i1.p1  ORF type:complete len:159 (-),score=6.78 TRINITY_DN12459_c0_g1_i1:450-926(-)
MVNIECFTAQKLTRSKVVWATVVLLTSCTLLFLCFVTPEYSDMGLQNDLCATNLTADQCFKKYIVFVVNNRTDPERLNCLLRATLILQEKEQSIHLIAPSHLHTLLKNYYSLIHPNIHYHDILDYSSLVANFSVLYIPRHQSVNGVEYEMFVITDGMY